MVVDVVVEVDVVVVVVVVDAVVVVGVVPVVVPDNLVNISRYFLFTSRS